MSERRKDVIDYLRTYDLPSLLREAGYDVREGWEQDVRGAPIVWDWKRKPEDGKPCLVVVLSV